MLGTLVSHTVEDGDEVVEGEETCIVEAMKTQNVICSTWSGIIKRCHAKRGLSLKMDGTIVEFEFE